jgi:hypothetical protein
MATLPVTVRVCKLDALATFRVDEFIKGIVRVSKLKTVLVELDVNPSETILVVVSVFDTTRFVKGWTMLEAWMFERVFPKIRDEGTTPNARLEAFRFESVFP